MFGLIIIFAWALKVPAWILAIALFFVLLRCLANEIREKEFHV